MGMDHRQVVRVLAASRAVVGFALLVAPGAMGRRWLGDVAADRRVRLALRGLGARDLALATGTLQALDRGTSVRPWAAMSAVGDASDAIGATLAWPTLGTRRVLLTVLTAGPAAVLGALAAPELD
jgi:hypothetical protein